MSNIMYAQIANDAGLNEEQVAAALERTQAALALDGKRALVIIPDATRSAPIPLLFRLLGDTFGRQACQLDYLIALGTHPPMSDEAIDHLVGMRADERSTRYPHTAIYNHQWDDPTTLSTLGRISEEETRRLTNGLLATETVVTINRRLLDYDHIIICGPVFPHEVAGFSGGAKYLFPGVAGPEIINYTHWLGALVTTMKTIGVKDTPVRRVITRAAELLPRPVTCLALVMRESLFCGLYVGDVVTAFGAAADYSARLNIVYQPRAYNSVLSAPSTRYADLWTAAKAMYKTEPIVADGGEVIIYAPHITEVSYTHGALIDRIGYHVRDYFLDQWERFRDAPGMILAHSTHVRGAGTYDAATGIESPRIQVTLATGIPRERCERINLGYRDHRELDPRNWADREPEGRLLVEHAGEVLYRLQSER
jgi:nickel-dependent lactate racemase